MGFKARFIRLVFLQYSPVECEKEIRWNGSPCYPAIGNCLEVHHHANWNGSVEAGSRNVFSFLLVRAAKTLKWSIFLMINSIVLWLWIFSLTHCFGQRSSEKKNPQENEPSGKDFGVLRVLNKEKQVISVHPKAVISYYAQEISYREKIKNNKSDTHLKVTVISKEVKFHE